MTFAALPLAILAGLAAAVVGILVALYLLRRTPPPEVVSNIDFWRRAIERAEPRLLRSSRVPWISLLLSILVGLLVLTELGDPRFGRGIRGTTVIVLNAGQSMATTDGSGTRYDAALELAEEWAARATAGGEVAVVRAGLDSTTLVPWTEDGGAFARALRATPGAREADAAPADLAGAVALADALIAARGGAGQILVVSDQWLEAQARSPVTVLPVGAHADSVGITSLVARRDPVAIGEYAVTVGLRSFSSRVAIGKLVVRDRDVVVFEQAFELAAGESRLLSGQGFSSAEGELTARLEDVEIAGSEDALAADDVAFAVAPPLRRLRVLVVSPGNPWLRAALDAHGSMDITEATALPANVVDHDVVILDRIAPPAQAALPGAFVIAPPTAVAGVAPRQALDAPALTASLLAHPALGGVRLDAANVERATALAPTPADTVVLRSGDHALAVARDRAGARLLVLGFALSDTDLVERATFPLFLHHAIGWLAHRAEPSPYAAAPGALLRTSATTPILDPDGDAAEHDGVHVAGAPGIWHVGAEAVAVSSAASSAGLARPLAAARTDLSRFLPPLGVLVAAALLLVMVLEWALLHRGRIA